MKPLEILATALAYVIRADNVTTVSEKADLVALLHKHVVRGEVTEKGLKDLTAKAFTYAEKIDFETFLEKAPAGLTLAQRLAIYINLIDTMLIDGKVVDGEVRIVRKMEMAFGLDHDTAKAMHDVLSLKNDTTVFTNFLHPKNEPDFTFLIRRKF